MAKKDEKLGPVFERDLEVPISAQAKAKKLERIAATDDELDEQNRKRTAATAGFTAKIKELQTENRRLRDEYRKGTELRKVKCITRYRYSNQTVQVIRQDTKAVVEERTMTAAEIADGQKKTPPGDKKGGKVLKMLDGGKGAEKPAEKLAEPEPAPEPQPA